MKEIRDPKFTATRNEQRRDAYADVVEVPDDPLEQEVQQQTIESSKSSDPKK